MTPERSLRVMVSPASLRSPLYSPRMEKVEPKREVKAARFSTTTVEAPGGSQFWRPSGAENWTPLEKKMPVRSTGTVPVLVSRMNSKSLELVKPAVISAGFGESGW